MSPSRCHRMDTWWTLRTGLDGNAIAGIEWPAGPASLWGCLRTLTSIILETTGNVTALTASNGISVLCLEGIGQSPVIRKIFPC